MAGTTKAKNQKVKNAQNENVFLHFNLDAILSLVKERKCPVCGKPFSRLHPIRHGEKYYVYADHGTTLHYIAPLQSYDYVLENLKAVYYLYKCGKFSKQQIADLIYFVFQLIYTESTEDQEFKKIMKNSIKQLLEQ